MDSDVFDVVVVGGGPAGALAAAHAAMGGLSCALVDKHDGPTQKVCGEFLSPLSRRLFEEIGLWDRWAEIGLPTMDRVAVTARGQRLERALPTIDGCDSFGLSRQQMDLGLRRRCVELGVTPLFGMLATDLLGPGTADGSEPLLSVGVRSLPGPALAGNPRPQAATLKARAVVVADGKIHSLARRSSARDDEHAPGDAPSRQSAPRPPVADASSINESAQLGVKLHMTAVQMPASTIELHSFRGGYVGISPVEQGRWNTCCAVDAGRFRELGNDPRALVEAMARENPHYAAEIKHAEWASEPLVCPLPRYRLRPAAMAGVHVVGNAAGAFDPFIGEGMYNAMVAGRTVGRLLSRHGPSLEGWRQVADALAQIQQGMLSSRYHSGKLFSAVAGRPRLAAWTCRLLQLVPRVVDRAIRWSGKSANNSAALV